MWEGLEDSLRILFEELTDLQFLTAVAVFGALVSSQARNQMTVAASDVFFINYPAHGRRMRRFLQGVGKHSTLRNDIAHGIVLETKNGSYLYPPSYAQHKQKTKLAGISDPVYKYTAKQIETMGDQFCELVEDINTAIELVRRFVPRVPRETIPPLLERGEAWAMRRVKAEPSES